MARTVAEGLWKMLASAGVRRCYGIVGDALNPDWPARCGRDAAYRRRPPEGPAAGFIGRPFSSQATRGGQRRLGLRPPEGGRNDPRECGRRHNQFADARRVHVLGWRTGGAPPWARSERSSMIGAQGCHSEGTGLGRSAASRDLRQGSVGRWSLGNVRLALGGCFEGAGGGLAARPSSCLGE